MNLLFFGHFLLALNSPINYNIDEVSGLLRTHYVSSEHPLLIDVREITLTGETRLKKQESMDFAYGDKEGIFLAERVMGEGRGRIILLVQPDLLTNREIDKKDNLVLFLNIVRLYGQEGIWFNEFAHGYTWEKSAREVFTWPLRLVVIQLALGVLLLYYYWGKRFGRPLPAPQHAGHLSGEYVSSLAAIYRQGRARRLTLESIYQGFKIDLTQYLGVPKSISRQELVKIFFQRPRIDAGRLEKLLQRCEGLLGKSSLSETELLNITGELEIWRENNLVPYRERRKNHDR